MKKLLEEAKAQMEALKKVLKDKEDEISKSKKELRQAKEGAIKEYYNSNALLSKLGSSFTVGFNDCLCQVNASFLDLDLSHITIDTKGQTSTRPVDSEGTNELFADDTTLDPQGDKDIAPYEDQVKSIEDEARPLEGIQTAEKKDGDTPADQQ